MIGKLITTCMIMALVVLQAASVLGAPTNKLADASRTSDRCHLRSLLPPLFNVKAVEPLFAVDDCEDCAAKTMTIYLGCKKGGGNDCYCSFYAWYSCGEICPSPCKVCLDWGNASAGFCAEEAPKAPPTKPGGN